MKTINDKLAAAFVGFLLLFGILGGVLIHNAVAKREEEDKEPVSYYTFAEVEKPVSYLASDDETLFKLSRLIDPLYKSDNIDVIYVQQMTKTLGLDETIYSDLLAGFRDDEWVPAELFDKIYERIIDSGKIRDIQKKPVFFYEVTYYDETESLLINNQNTQAETATAGDAADIMTPGDSVTGETAMAAGNAGVSAQNKESEEGRIATAVFDGITSYVMDNVSVPDRYLNRIVTAYFKNDVIFKLGNESDDTMTFYNVWIEAYQDGSCTFMPDRKLEVFPVKEDVNGKQHCIADITFDNDGIISIDFKDQAVKGRVTSVTEEGIRVEGEGVFPYNEYYKIYNISGEEPYREDTSNTLIGYKETKLIVADGMVQAAVIEDEIATENIRVILNDSSYTSYKHIVADITGEGAFTVTVNDEEPVTYAAGEEIRILPKDYKAKDVIKITSVNPSDKLILNNVARSSGTPAYRGTLEITVKNDYLYIVNDLPLEEYLYAVVSSEVPSSYAAEAQKAMAICARGYAYSKMQDGSYASYGAHVDDSTMCQVYNNIPETETSIFAVKDTYGLIPTYDGKVMVPFYFSTSAGVTCSNDDIWGGSPYAYLTSNVETLDKQKIDLSEDENFRKFIADSYGYDTIEQELPFYRWSIRFSNQEISAAINSTLKERIAKSDGGIKVKMQNGTFKTKKIDSIGEVESVEITKRSESGVVLEMVIYGSEYVIQVTGQTNIRNLITPKDVTIVRNDGSAIEDWTSLPSPYYYIDQVQGGFNIIGGGFGHGVGLSQNGAEILAEQGYNYKYILSHYFSYVDYTYIYEDNVKEDEEQNEE